MAFTKAPLVGRSQASVLISMNQTHSKDVVLIEKTPAGLVAKNSMGDSTPMAQDDHGNGAVIDFLGPQFVVKADACITCERNVLLSVKTADCLPILLAASGYIAVIHAGRQGTLNGITRQVCEQLKQMGGSIPIAWFGPATCLFCYQVDRDTNTYFDLVEDNRSQIMGVFGAEAVIEYSGACTQCESNLYYSYRSGDLLSRNVFYLSK